MCKTNVFSDESLYTARLYKKSVFLSVFKLSLDFVWKVNIPELSPSGSLVSVEVAGRECYNVTFGRGGAERARHPLE